MAVAVALAAGLGACAGSETDTPTLTWYINPDDGGQAELARTCTEEADGRYQVETSLLPRDASSQREQLARRLAAGDASIDIVSLDPPFIPELAEPGFLAPVPEDLQNTEGVVQGAVDSATWDGELVTVPFWANTQLLWYRTSVVEAAGLDMSQPVTWAQIIEVAEEEGKLLGVQGTKAEALTVWINALIASAGGQVIVNPEAPADEVELGMDSPAARAAAEIVSAIGEAGLGGAGLTTADENASMNVFASDEGSFMVNWPFVYPALSAADPAVVEDMGWTIYPRVSEDQEPAPPVGGINLGVGAFSRYPDLAYDAIACIIRPEHQAQYFVTNGNPPSAVAAYDEPEVQEQFPMADTIRDSLELAVPRPQTPYYNDLSLSIQETWHPVSAVDPGTTPAESASFIIAVLRGESLI
ncbi:extracellular solute-binding protein [Georgenia faecalis]|uniref:Extracellular solute-binding protein n=1 Tax=Georgenia faecalis TaxID=2483799 RepID=A0ABV9DBS5_9MICO|nr:extracellular solute-binding protein [Georgenia faecalis]